MAVLSRFWAPNRDKIVRLDTKSVRGTYFRSPIRSGAILEPDEYIETRVRQYQSWYDRKASISKSRYLRMRGASVVGGAVVPALVNIDFTGRTAVVTVVSLLVVVIVSLESVLHYREQWKNYRSTEQLLGHEIVYFTTGVGPYKGLAGATAYDRFVERVEAAIASENAATLNTMTVASEATPPDAQRTDAGVRPQPTVVPAAAVASAQEDR